MIRFSSSLATAVLNRNYLRCGYNLNLLENKYNALLLAYPDLKAALPADCTLRKLLVGKFDYLTKVYFAYRTYYASLDEADAILLKDKASSVFNYGSHKTKIRNFLINPANGFEIYNCVYCDLNNVRVQELPDGTIKRKFDTEHVLDKGECPLVALSLYNFVPSCKDCNGPNYKGTNPIGSTEDEVKRLSPTAIGYDFENNAKFVVNPKDPNFDDLEAALHPGDFSIDIVYKDPVYKVFGDLFHLVDRYNERPVLVELLMARDKARTTPPNIIKEFAAINGCSVERMYDIFFEFETRRREHFPKEKARRDIMLM